LIELRYTLDLYIVVRTQIYLTDEERKRLRALNKTTGRKQSELIRAAIDEFLQRNGAASRLALIRKARGIWKGRKQPDLRALRGEWSRR